MFTGRVDDIGFDDEEYMKRAGHHVIDVGIFFSNKQQINKDLNYYA